ncbi:conserved hypothetical protein [Nitrosococcus oceani ATCC 19707]|uniref:DUF2141 domain-containing protein n=2 Tax=Nitrosococcus oceani TaxID=1229 RepID=Q3JAS3_NITOC|nr:conserved hypothetical protein [Nitrosococcus oceani ATCC 19707]EDZ67554.1 hypothetical protein NOC27_881 [Nitrosococcus oceani AFC27]KFI19495.1 hypothetical protein IB75_08450 [Nitrosococcus oceani C-27]
MVPPFGSIPVIIPSLILILFPMFFKPFRIIFFATGIILCFYPVIAGSGEGNTIVIKVTGIEPVEGQVQIALYNAPERWLEESFAHATIEVKGREAEWRVEGIPDGAYAVATFHDRNGNGKADRNWLGIPKEAYGFSNNVKAVFKPPQWNRVKFIVARPVTAISIELGYWN